MRISISTSIFPIVTATLLAACTTSPKAPVDDDFSALASADQKSDAFSSQLTIVGSLSYGQTSAPTKYTKTPRYRAFKFSGQPGDSVDVWVRSPTGDAVAWVLDNSFHTLASNDDADATTLDSHVTLTLPASPSATHYIVFRDYDLRTEKFTVELTGGPAIDTSCVQDSDCVAISAGGCCPDGTLATCNADGVAAYDAAHACTTGPQICPDHEVLDTRVAECAAGQCVLVEPDDIHCGGFTPHPHTCPTGYTCDKLSEPAGGTCVAN